MHVSMKEMHVWIKGSSVQVEIKDRMFESAV